MHCGSNLQFEGREVLGFRTRVAIVTAAALFMYGASGMTIATRDVVHTVKEPVVVHDSTTAPDGKITRAECGKLQDMSFKDVVNRYGMPADFSPGEDTFFDSFSYPLRGEEDEDKGCNVYFEYKDGVVALDENTSNYIVRNVSVDL